MYQNNTYTYINTATTTTILDVPGMFIGIDINQTLTGTVTINDTDGTTTETIAVFDSTSATQTHTLNANLTRGLQVVTSAADSVTVLSRRGA